jgi:hypothetical protein
LPLLFVIALALLFVIALALLFVIPQRSGGICCFPLPLLFALAIVLVFAVALLFVIPHPERSRMGEESAVCPRCHYLLLSSRPERSEPEGSAVRMNQQSSRSSQPCP